MDRYQLQLVMHEEEERKNTVGPGGMGFCRCCLAASILLQQTVLPLCPGGMQRGTISIGHTQAHAAVLCCLFIMQLQSKAAR